MKLTISIALLALCASVASLVFVFKGNQKIIFVDIEKVYNNFTMKKELEAKFDNVMQMRQHILDSLKLEVELLSKRISSEKDVANINAFQVKRQEYLMKEQSFTESTQATNEQYKNEIWKQLSQYVREYGKKNGCTYILGFENKSTVLYGNEAEDQTKEVESYVNEAYKGNAK